MCLRTKVGSKRTIKLGSMRLRTKVFVLSCLFLATLHIGGDAPSYTLTDFFLLLYYTKKSSISPYPHATSNLYHFCYLGYMHNSHFYSG